MFAALIIALILLYAVHYLAARPEVIFVTFVVMGILLLIAAQKGNPYSQYMYDWIDGRWHIDMLSASITALSLALTFGAILISVGRTKK
jgi:hypothetical protein